MREFCFVKGKKNLVPGASDSVQFHMRVQTFTFGVLTDFCLATGVQSVPCKLHPTQPPPTPLYSHCPCSNTRTHVQHSH